MIDKKGKKEEGEKISFLICFLWGTSGGQKREDETGKKKKKGGGDKEGG